MWEPEGLPAELELLSDIVIVVGIPFFFIFGTWLLCLNLGELSDRGFVQSLKDELFDLRCRTGIKTVLVVLSMVSFCAYLISAYISESIIGMASAEAPWWVQVFAGVAAFVILICIIVFFASGDKKDKS